MSKRKPPKNLRPYATPSGKKARMVEVTGDELHALLDREGKIDVPTLYSMRVDKYKHFFCNADELAKWRASQTTSGEKA